MEKFPDLPMFQGANAASRIEVSNLANTTPVVFNKTLFALREDSPPIAMDPITAAGRRVKHSRRSEIHACAGDYAA